MNMKKVLDEINSELHSLHSQFDLLRTQQAKAKEKYNSTCDKCRIEYEKKRESIEELQEDIYKYYRIAKESSEADINALAQPLAPDIGLLNSLIGQVNEYNRNDPLARRIIELCSSYLAYLKYMMMQISSEEKKSLQQIEHAYQMTNQKIIEDSKKIVASCSTYLNGQEVKELKKAYDVLRSRDYSYDKLKLVSYYNSKQVLFGYKYICLDVPQALKKDFANNLPKVFNAQTNEVQYPFGISFGECSLISIDYGATNERILKKGIQAFVCNLIRLSLAKGVKIAIEDSVYYNSQFLGPLSSLSNKLIDLVATNDDSLKKNNEFLVNYYKKIEKILGTKSVYEYNSEHNISQNIPYRILLINQEENHTVNSCKSNLSYLINNALRLGIIVIFLCKRSVETLSKKFNNVSSDFSPHVLRICSNENGEFYCFDSDGINKVTFMDFPDSIPDSFVDNIKTLYSPVLLGNEYFKRFKMQLPQKSIGRRKPISLPFAVDENDKVMYCTFENNDFAAYIMGAAGSGKSTLLHTLITGILLGYHPDEVELWLLDFKTIEFKKYFDSRPPHLKYLLLEKSEDLVFDIIDQMTGEMSRREKEFAKHGWTNIVNVPVNAGFPTIIVIIDEFAQMSQIIKETKGTGYDTDYTLKLENLLAKGRALGFKFIFASQTYTTGISGLTETACKQIQMRFAMKNSTEEIKQTLSMNSSIITPEIEMWINTLPKYETLFRWQAIGDDEFDIQDCINKFRNLYVKDEEIERLTKKLCNSLVPVVSFSQDPLKYIEKNPILIEGGVPKTFISLIPQYKLFEKKNSGNYESDSILIYPGVPRSFFCAKPFELKMESAENVLILNGNADQDTCILLSIINSVSRFKGEFEIWSHRRSSVVRKYGSSKLHNIEKRNALDEICTEIQHIKQLIMNKQDYNKTIFILDMENLYNDFEMLAEDSPLPVPKSSAQSKKTNIKEPPTTDELMEMLSKCADKEEKARIISEYNAQVDEYNNAMYGNQLEDDSTNCEKDTYSEYDARNDMSYLLRRAGAYGCHFVCFFKNAHGFINSKIKNDYFRHKISFAMSKEDALNIFGSRKANELEPGVCFYTNGISTFTFTPHIYKDVYYGDWIVGEKGNVIQKE